MKNKIMSLLFVISFANVGQAADNEIMIDQTGNVFKLYIDQVGYGNTIGADDFSSTGTVMDIDAINLTLDIDQIGNLNQLYGVFKADNSDWDLLFTGDSNIFDWNIGYGSSADSSTVDLDVTGSSNTFDFDQGYITSAERLDFDLVLVGGSNVWDLDFESDDATWNWDYTGSNSNINTNMTDGGYHIQNVTMVGDSADIDITQSSGTCPSGPTSCSGQITLDVTSDNAIIQIIQSDTSD
tara:strand:- start:1092 stop:1808 length:717 start_codon:yes stop_codon:yes gene_type:complete